MVVFILPPLEILFLGKLGPKNQKCQFELKIGTKTNLNMKNSMVMFISPVFNQKYPFLEICFVSQNSLLSYNLEPRLIGICRIQYYFSFCLDWKYPFWVNLVQ